MLYAFVTFALALSAPQPTPEVLAASTMNTEALDAKIQSAVTLQLQKIDEAKAQKAAEERAKAASLDALADRIAKKVRAASLVRDAATIYSCTCTWATDTSTDKSGVTDSKSCTAACFADTNFAANCPPDNTTIVGFKNSPPCNIEFSEKSSSSGGSSSGSSSSTTGGSSSSGGGSSSSTTGSSSTSSGSCFAKDSTTVCLLASPEAECEPALMADLVPGDLVLGRDGATTVIANQHKDADTIGEMLTFHTAGGSVSMTPDHAVFADGALIAAADVAVGAALSTGTVKRISKGEAPIINAVTVDGTIVADGVLAASNPMWIASLTVDAPLSRAVVNAALYAVGDVDSVAAGFAKVATTLVGVAVAAKALRTRKASA